MTGPADLTLVEAADAVLKRKLSSLELLDACFANIERANQNVNATIWLDYEAGRKSARKADQAVKKGAKLGRLHGVPMAHKDMFYRKGKPCTCGSRIRKDFVPELTATVLARMDAAGAYSFGGLNMAEFALNTTGHNREFGDCHNPWNSLYIPGGSSSGSGAAVAARMTYAALGSDTGGSIRLPAAACGVTGIKPTQTRVSRAGVMPLSFSGDNVGPLARTARDCARILSVIAGHDRLDPTTSTEKVPDYEAALDGEVGGLKIGVPTKYFLDNADRPVALAFEEAIRVLGKRGATVKCIALPQLDAILAYSGIMSRVEVAAIHAQWMRNRPQDYAPHISSWLYTGYAVPASYHVEALSRRGPILTEFAKEVFSLVDVVATPTIPTCLPTLTETDVDIGPPGIEGKVLTIHANTAVFNYLGLPSASVNCGFDPNGLPIGLSFTARPFAEASVLKVADAYQRETDWHTRRPSLLA
ncbi:amidase [Mesorhizobium sp. VK25A]|uniref:Indoleacetamide hydrolase n=1 Tax=Mesorhizobium vachelliae TaxID=3072309 RepID=A0ABU5AF67_9HYPH|nr:MULTISPECIES: amidase [unclassified Mesorhizobium]MDX8535920.1 amidase [Mesorhizobium sp. VK25D]MDX8548672.1 amidase [Mesorhizobium sp. VK25A]